MERKKGYWEAPAPPKAVAPKSQSDSAQPKKRIPPTPPPAPVKQEAKEVAPAAARPAAAFNAGADPWGFASMTTMPPGQSVPPNPSSIHLQSVGQQGFKGYGKGNMGVPVQSSKTYEELQAGSNALEHHWLPAPAEQTPAAVTEPKMPDPRKITDEEVANWFKTSFMEINTTGGSHWPPQVGDAVLWKGEKKGPKGYPSTKEEMFNGTVHDIIFDVGDGVYRFGVT